MTKKLTVLPAGSLARNGLQTHNIRSISLGLWLFSAAYIIGCVEFTHDYWLLHTNFWIYKPTLPPLFSLRNLILKGIAILIGMLAVMGVFRLLMAEISRHVSSTVRIFLGLLFLTYAYGAMVGFIKGVRPEWILGETRNFIVYLTLFAIPCRNPEKRMRYLRNLFIVGCTILALKLLVGFAIRAAAVVGPFVQYEKIKYDLIGSGRWLLKLSIFFPPMFYIALSHLLSGGLTKTERRKYFWLVVLAVGGIYVSGMLGIYLGAFVGLLLAFFMFICVDKKRLSKSIRLGTVSLGVMMIMSVFLHGDVKKVFQYVQGAKNFRLGAAHRLKQIDMHLTIFKDNWITGAGLGHYDHEAMRRLIVWSRRNRGLGPDPISDSGDALLKWPRPYISEMEYFNLLRKLGVVGFSMFVSAFGVLFWGCLRMCRRAATSEQRGFIVGLTAGLVSIIVAGMTNATYSSMYFHLYVVFVLLVLSDLNMLKRETLLVRAQVGGVR